MFWNNSVEELPHAVTSNEGLQAFIQVLFAREDDCTWIRKREPDVTFRDAPPFNPNKRSGDDGAEGEPPNKSSHIAGSTNDSKEKTTFTMRTTYQIVDGSDFTHSRREENNFYFSKLAGTK